VACRAASFPKMKPRPLQVTRPPSRLVFADLAAAEIKSEQTRRYVVEVPPVLDRDEYGQNPSLPPPSLQ
jgi:hypothetical protein